MEVLSTTLIVNVLIAFGAFQALFVAAIILTRPNRELPARFFSYFLIIEGITLIERLLAESGLINAVPHLLGISYPISFLKPALILMMASAIIDPNFRLRKIHLLHLIPFLIILLMNLPFYFLPPQEKLAIVSEFIHRVPEYLSFEFFFSLSFFFHIGSYLLVTITKLRGFTKKVKNNRLATWNLRVLLLYCLFLGSHFLYFVSVPSGLFHLPQFNNISMLIMTFVIQSIAFSFIQQSSIFVNKGVPDPQNADKHERDENLIKAGFEVRQLHLDDALTLEKFATALELPSKYISNLVHQRFGCSFRELVNQYRVESAKKMITQDESKIPPLIEIALESGFNNKVTFYRAFKKHVGMSPSDYKRHQLMARSAAPIRQ